MKVLNHRAAMNTEELPTARNAPSGGLCLLSVAVESREKNPLCVHRGSVVSLLPHA